MKHKKLLIVVGVFVAITLSGAAGATIYANWPHTGAQDERSEDKGNKQENTPIAQEPVKKVYTPSEITQYIKATLAKDYQIVDNHSHNLSPKQLYISPTNQAAIWKAPGTSIYTSYAGGSGIDLTGHYSEGSELPSTTTIAVRNTISTILATEFELSRTDTVRRESDVPSGVTFYENDYLVCSATIPEEMSTSTRVACGEKEKYTEIAPLAQKFHQLSSSSDTTSPYAGVSSIEVRESQTPGYQSASASLYDLAANMGGSRGLFYKTPDSDWRFFTATQQTLPCSDYRVSEDIRIAFADEPCDEY